MVFLKIEVVILLLFAMALVPPGCPPEGTIPGDSPLSMSLTAITGAEQQQ